MSDPTPLDADQIDELLSAELDGEFDAAAHDLGFAPADARARMQATDGVEARRRALTEARDRLAEPPAIDELLEARLQAKALNAWAEQREEHESLRRSSRRRRMYTMTGALAAAITAVVVIAAVARNPANRDDTAASRAESVDSPGAVATEAPSASLDVDFGKVADVPTLVTQARDVLPITPAAGAGAGDATSNKKSQLRYQVNDSGELAPQVNAATKRNEKCGQVAQQASQLSTPFLRGTASVDGAPVYVFVYRTDTKELVIVLDDACNLVTQRTGPPRTG